MTHWCRDIPRDEAVRASEDGRSDPLPTLEECIAAASPLPGRVEGTHWADWERLRAERITQALTADRFASAVAEADRLKARVAELEAAPAASGAANSSGSPESSEPDAWGVRRKGGVDAVVHRLFRSSAEQSAEQYGGTVVPLFTSPPPARGWLTEEERRWVEDIKDNCVLPYKGMKCMEAILARSTTPPDVVLPAANRAAAPTYVEIVEDRDGQWLAALAAAGVPVKEVGRE